VLDRQQRTWHWHVLSECHLRRRLEHQRFELEQHGEPHRRTEAGVLECDVDVGRGRSLLQLHGDGIGFTDVRDLRDPAARRHVQYVIRSAFGHAVGRHDWYVLRDDHRDEYIRQYEPGVHVERHGSLGRKGGIVRHFPIKCLTVRYGPLVEQKKSIPQG